jgi:hypothetical protein
MHFLSQTIFVALGLLLMKSIANELDAAFAPAFADIAGSASPGWRATSFRPRIIVASLAAGPEGGQGGQVFLGGCWHWPVVLRYVCDSTVRRSRHATVRNAPIHSYLGKQIIGSGRFSRIGRAEGVTWFGTGLWSAVAARGCRTRSDTHAITCRELLCCVVIPAPHNISV